jgi:hypothetical protein
MPFLLVADTVNPGDANWDAAETIPGIGGGTQVVSLRIQLGDLPANTSYLANLPAIPALSAVSGAAYYLSSTVTGGGVTSCTVDLRIPAPAFFSVLELEQLVGASVGFSGGQNGNADISAGGPIVSQNGGNPVVALNADVNLDTLATFDLTVYLFFAQVPNLAVPV